MAERKSICPMVRCFAAITSMPPNYMAQMRRKRVRPRCICKRNSDMTNHTPCLLDEAATFMKVQYLSDLRFLSTDGRSRLAAFLETFDAAEYTLFQWNDAIEYLKAGVKQQTAQGLVHNSYAPLEPSDGSISILHRWTCSTKHPELAFPSCAPTISIRTKEDQICPGLSAMEKAMWRLSATIR